MYTYIQCTLLVALLLSGISMRSGADSKANTWKYAEKAHKTIAISRDRRSPHSPLFRRGTPSNSVSSIRLYRKPRESPAVEVGAPIEPPSLPRSIGVSVRCYYR